MIAIRPFRDLQKLIWGCRSKALPKRSPRVHPQTQFGPTAIFTDTVNFQVSKAELFVLGGGGKLLAVSFQS